jgi:hypothetical protein
MSAEEAWKKRIGGDLIGKNPVAETSEAIVDMMKSAYEAGYEDRDKEIREENDRHTDVH